MHERIAAVDDDLLSPLLAELETLRKGIEHQQRLATTGTLAAGVIHEINNLLTPVLAYAQLAIAKPDDRQLTSRALQQCVCAVESASSIADALLDFATPDATQSVADVGSVIDQAVICLGPEPARSGIEVTTTVGTGLLAAISPLALQQVLLNLLTNAVHALHGRRNAQLTIEATAGVGAIQLAVTDNGPGISPAAQEHLFEPFAVSRETSGHGLGLWICKRLIEQAGGELSLVSSSGGTTFTVELPPA